MGDVKNRITIKDLLMMSSGLRWPGNEAMIPSKNWVRFTLEQPVESEPGNEMNYSCGNSHLLSAILQHATKMDTVMFAKKHLFTPLGIQDFNWHHDAQGVAIGGFSLTMKIEDMLKFGILYLQKGKWNSNQVIPADWIDKSTEIKMTTSDLSSYGYHWWILNEANNESSKTYFARGMGGQYIVVNEEQRIVTVFTSDMQGKSTSPIEYFQNYILC